MATSRCAAVSLTCCVFFLVVCCISLLTSLVISIYPLAYASGVAFLIACGLAWYCITAIQKDDRDAEREGVRQLHAFRRPPAEASTGRNSDRPVPGTSALFVQRPTTQMSSARPPTVTHTSTRPSPRSGTVMLPVSRVDATQARPGSAKIDGSSCVSACTGEVELSWPTPGHSVEEENNLSAVQDDLPSYTQVVVESFYEKLNRLKGHSKKPEFC
eukprot:scpid85882/ scgid34117/ 